MADPEVKIERLGPMYVAWVRAFGPNPEQKAWSTLRVWAQPRGLLEQPAEHRVFGFNNPPAAQGATEYGYEMWISVDAETQPSQGIGVKSFPGGLYAVTSCPLVGGAGVPAMWKTLLRWVHTSQYTWRRGAHELERIRNPLSPERDVLLDLYLPIEG